jgi:hypothetical protein
VKPLCIDLFAGLGGWAEGFLSEGYYCVGFDIERHDYGSGGYPGDLVLQDVLTLHGSQFKDAACIVASPPCQAYSYRAMPWKRAKALPPPSNELFDACFRIQKEAIEAAGHYIPMVVENVRGAIPWVGRSRWHYGSFHLWGDVPALMPMSSQPKTIRHANIRDGFSHTRHLTNQRESDAVKGSAGGWFNDSKRSGMATTSGYLSRSGSKSPARKAASAQIAKIPFPLARHIAETYYPQQSVQVTPESGR